MKQGGREYESERQPPPRFLICPSCKEKNNPAFTQCWKCGLDFITGETHMPAQKDEMKPWKVYFWFMAVILVRGLFAVIAKPNFMDIIGSSFDVLTFIALFGFCFNRKIGSSMFWKVGFFASLSQEILLSMSKTKFLILDTVSGQFAYAVAVALCFLLVVPLYVAMYRYAFMRTDIWSGRGDDGGANV